MITEPLYRETQSGYPLAERAKGAEGGKVRFLGGDIETLRKMTEEEWEKAKEKARQW